MGATVTAFVDSVLGDLRLPDGMFVGRRADAQDCRSIVIQTGEDGRHRVAVDAGAWVCPDGDWRCAVGDYVERTWPPDVGAGHLAAVLCGRLQWRGIRGWRQLGFTRRGHEWVAQVKLWPMDAAVMDAVERAAAPLRVEFQPDPGPPPRYLPLRPPPRGPPA